MQSGVPDRSTGGDWPKLKIKKSRIPTVATPSDSESAEDDNVSRIMDSDADFPDPVGSDDEQSSSGDVVVGEDYVLPSYLYEMMLTACTIC